MDLIPKPDQVVAAASNVAHKLIYGSVADLRAMPRTLIDEGNLREVYHYRPAPGVEETGDPVLLITPLAAPALCYDLRRSCSLVEHLVQQGRPTYLVEYGEVQFKDRALGIEHWIDEVVPNAVRAASEHAGGRPVHLVGWSLGGIFALLTAADSPDLPIASVTSLGAPFDVAQVPLVAPLRPLLTVPGLERGAITRVYQAVGGAPKPVVKWAFQLTSVQKLVTKPLALARNLDDADFLAQIEAVDRFAANMIAYPGRTFGQLYHRFVKGNQLRHGAVELDHRTIELAAITVPVLVFAGATDGIAPVASVRTVLPMLTGAEEVRFEIVPGGHLGMLTGRAARETTWVTLDEWLTEWSGRAAAKKTARKSTAKKAPARKSAAKKSTAKKAPAKKAPAKAAKAPAKKTPAKATKATARKTPAKKGAKRSSARPSREAIGSNTQRRYGSSGSRALAR
ncbi:alpha/beta fold hydrolase [Nocardioides rotundus]|uniref:alpha/beta fold hydrolase n=1 Tax=Nocardioides rotundus TaxID=1774216 RepID=UPI001CC03FB8|nr:alpha/beta fold hydrolase [Nocardioides rotundus]UAL30774.1 alpha/beta fold hydrolase [Nocardioides rotundus]